MILYVSTSFGGYAGSDLSSLDFLSALRKTGHSVAVMTMDVNENFVASSLGSVNGLPVFSLEQGGALPPKFHKGFFSEFGQWMLSLLSNRRSLKRLKKLEVEWVIYNEPRAKLWADQYDGWPGAYKSMILRNDPDAYIRTLGPGTEVSAFFDKTVSECEHFIGVSRATLNQWANQGRLENKRSDLVYNCIDELAVKRLREQPKKTIREALAIPLEQPTVVCVASIQYRKGQDYLLDILDDLPSGAMLYLVGPVLAELGGVAIIERLAAHPYKDRVTIVGATDLALEYVYAADVLVLPSRGEALPRVVLEAMALGTPVVATDVAGIPEMITHNENGYLYAVGDQEALLKGIAFCLSNVSQMRQWAEIGEEKYEACFSRKHQVNTVAALVKARS